MNSGMWFIRDCDRVLDEKGGGSVLKQKVNALELHGTKKKMVSPVPSAQHQRITRLARSRSNRSLV